MKTTEDKTRLGLSLLIFAAIGFAATNNLTKLTYQFGVTTDSLLFVRTWLMVIVMGSWFLIIRRPFALPRREWGWLLLTGTLYSANAFTLLLSFSHIPVSIAILILYLYPAMVALFSAMLGEEPLRLITIMGLIMAFVGLALALQVGSSGLAPTGVILSFVSAIALAINLIVSGRVIRRNDSLTVTFYMMLVGAVIFSVLVLISGGLSLPGPGATTTAWVSLAAAILTAGFALAAFYAALAFVSGLRTAMIMNSEPVITIILATLFFGEAFGQWQIIGTVLVIAAICMVTLSGRSKNS